VTVTIASITASGLSGLSVVLRFADDSGREDRTEYIITAAQYGELPFLHPAAKAAGRVLTEEQADALAAAADHCAAVSRGLNLLSYGDVTVRGLADKLRSRGFSREVAAAAAEDIAARGAIDEESLLGRTVELCVRKGWGRMRIAAAVREKHFLPETLESLGGLLDEIDFVSSCAAVTEKKWGGVPEDAAARRKAVAALARLGYSQGEIRAAWRQVGDATGGAF